MYAIVAFNDVVGYVCTDDCAQDVIDDINGDNPGADAGYDPVLGYKGDDRCMGCGRSLA